MPNPGLSWAKEKQHTRFVGWNGIRFERIVRRGVLCTMLTLPQSWKCHQGLLSTVNGVPIVMGMDVLAAETMLFEKFEVTGQFASDTGLKHWQLLLHFAVLLTEAEHETGSGRSLFPMPSERLHEATRATRAPGVYRHAAR